MVVTAGAVEIDETTSVEEARYHDSIEDAAEVDDFDTINVPASFDVAEEDAAPAPR